MADKTMKQIKARNFSSIGTRFLAMAMLAAFLAACSGFGSKIDTEKDIADSLEKDAQSAPPPQLAAAMMPGEDGDARFGPADIEPRFDVNANSVSARNFFMGLVQGTDYNMALHPDVGGRVTLSLKNVTVPEVMDTVRDLYGFDFRRTRSGYMVLPANLQSRVYQVNYLNMNRTGKSETRVSSGQLSGGTDDSQESGNSNAISNRGLSNVQVRPSTKIETEGGSDFWAELNTTLTSVVGHGEGRNVVVNPQTGVILVRAMPDEHRQVEEYLSTIQDSAQRQVVLEAKIIEVELSEGFQTGINWAAVANSSSHNGNIVAGMVGDDDLFEDGLSNLEGSGVVLEPGVTNITGFGSQAFGGVFALAVNGTDFSAFVELLDAQGDAKVLSSPRVSTVNNQKAVIKVGSDEFFVTGIQSNTTTGTATNTNNTVQLTPFFSGIALDVTPQISEDGEVILHIHPSVSEVRDQAKEVSIGTSSARLPLAFSTVRESDSVIRARSGQIVVIGGLMKSSTNRQESGVPILGDIPVLGHLFRHTSEREVKSELVILLKPIVIDGDDDWERMTAEDRERFSN